MEANPELEIHEGKESVFSKAPRAKKYFATSIVYYGQFVHGVATTFLGPCVVDFSHKYNTDSEHVSKVFIVITIAYTVGALLAGVITNFVNRQAVALTVLVLGTAVMCSFPAASSITIFFVLGGILGFYLGGMDTAQQAWIFDIWRHECPPFVLALHFAYSVGTVVTPLLLSPFLNDEDEETTTTAADSSSSSSTELVKTEGSDLWIPFIVAGVLLGLAVISQIVLFLVFRKETKRHKRNEKAQEQPDKDVSTQEKKSFELPERRKMILVALSCCCIGSYQAFELGTMQFLPTFAHFSELKLTESESADVLTGLTVAYCVCRLIGIFVVLKTPPHFSLLGNHILLTAANVTFLFAGNSKTTLWAASVLMGCAMSTTFPSYFAYIEKYLFVSDSIMAIILVTGGVVSAIYPYIVGSSVEENPNVMVYANFATLAFHFASFGVTFWLTYFKGDAESGAKSAKTDKSSLKGENNNGFEHKDNELNNNNE